MKSLFMLLIATAIIFPSCRKSHSTIYSSSGIIKGTNPFGRACGAAYWIVINDTLGGCTFNSLPAGSGIDLTTASFPINVKLNWHYQEPETCAIIVIDAIEKVD